MADNLPDIGRGRGNDLSRSGALLGHSQAATTQRYSHLMDTAQRAATEHLGTLVRKNGA